MEILEKPMTFLPSLVPKMHLLDPKDAPSCSQNAPSGGNADGLGSLRAESLLDSKMHLRAGTLAGMVAISGEGNLLLPHV